MGAGPCAAEPVGGDTNVLVRAPGYHHRAEWLGRDEPGPFRPAPGAVLRSRTGGRNSNSR